MEPNLHYSHGRYRRFIDHPVALSDLFLSEPLTLERFKPVRIVLRVKPYTVIGGFRYPLNVVCLFLSCRIFCPLFGRQFLAVAQTV